MDMKTEIIKKIKEIAQEQNGCLNNDGEYIDYRKGDEEYLLDNEDVSKLAEDLIKLFFIYNVSQQRELLIDFYSNQNGGMNETNKHAIIREVDNYIESINCG